MELKLCNETTAPIDEKWRPAAGAAPDGTGCYTYIVSAALSGVDNAILKVKSAQFPSAPGGFRWRLASGMVNMQSTGLGSSTVFAGYPEPLRGDSLPENIAANSPPHTISMCMNTGWFNLLRLEAWVVTPQGVKEPASPGHGWVIHVSVAIPTPAAAPAKTPVVPPADAPDALATAISAMAISGTMPCPHCLRMFKGQQGILTHLRSCKLKPK
jgi:hypothetical protein